MNLSLNLSIFGICWLSVLVFCEKETEIDYSMVADKLMEMLKSVDKRVDKNYKSDTSSDFYGYPSNILTETTINYKDETCGFRINKNKIISTEESISNGASFIKFIKNVNVTSDCLKGCCQHNADREKQDPVCNSIVMNEKNNEGVCYLFDCKSTNVCTYTDHDGFMYINLIGEVTHDPAVINEFEQPSSTNSPHENALKQLGDKDDVINSLKHPQNNHETNSNAESITTTLGTTTESGYDSHDDLKCNNFQFKCENKHKPSIAPTCIAIYDLCDGIIQCADGSDENDCKKPEAKGEIDNSLLKENVNSDNSIKNHLQDQLHEQKNNKDDFQKEVKHPSEDVLSEKVIQNQVTDKLSTTQKSVTTPVIGKTTKALLKEAVVTVTDSSKVHNIVQTDKSPDIELNNAEKHDSSNDENLTIVGLISKVRIHSIHPPLNKTAVAILAMGLGITATLFVLLICSFRNFKRRLRKGRPLNSNEADYLINGMYL